MDRLTQIEQRLFEVHALVERGQLEVDYFESRVEEARRVLSAAEARMAEAETSLAQRECCAARKRLEAAKAAVNDARRALCELEADRDGLLAKLVG
jgi:chromosome segregation ATPase